MAKMSSEEKRRLLKEQYKRDFQKRKEFLKDVEKYKHSKKLNDAIQNITSGLTNEDSDDWISKLNEETALTEAKMEMAIDEAKEQQQMLEQLAKEAEMEKLQALDLVEKMKQQMGLSSKKETQPETEDTVDSKDNTNVNSESKKSDSSDDDKKPPFKKTMGDF